MTQFKCKHCLRPMDVNFLEYSSNSYCNLCFDERADSKNTDESRLNTFEFMGDVIPLEQEATSSQTTSDKWKEYQMENKLIAKGITTDLNSYTFSIKTDEPIIVITEDGFKYKGELIEDKGEVYKLFKNYLTSSQTEISDEEIKKAAHEHGYEHHSFFTAATSNQKKLSWIAACKWYREQLKQK